MPVKWGGSPLWLAPFLIAPHLLTVGAVAAETMAATQPAAEAQKAEPLAESLHRRGVAAYDRGRYAEAIELFRQADRTRPSAAHSFNVARAYDKLHDVPAALSMYRDFLRRSPGAADPHTLRRVAALEGELAQRGVQQVTVLSTPEGATVLVDGQPVGVTPWTSELAPGEHLLAIRRPGYADVDAPFTLPKSNALELSYELSTARAAVGEVGPTVAPPPPPRAGAPKGEPPAADRRADGPWTTVGAVALGGGGLLMGGALTFELLRRSAEADAEQEPRQERAAEHLGTAESRQQTARILLGAGAALAVAGGVVLTVGLSGRAEAPRTRAALSCLPSRCFASAAGHF